MLEAITAAALAHIEQELLKHAPEIQEMLLKQLDNVATLIFDYVQDKLRCEAEAPKLEAPTDEPQQ